MVKKLFGTDGVRGLANTQLSAELAFRLGQAAVNYLGKHILIGKDTRKSGDLLEFSLAAGIMSEGGTPELAGIIPTPALALLVRDFKADGAIVVSASHNPPEYNGIKFFNDKGLKLPDKLEETLEDFVLSGASDPLSRPLDGQVGSKKIRLDAQERYIEYAIRSSEPLSGLSVALDLAHGAAYQTSKQAFERLGAKVFVINDDFSGNDINVNCGSTHLKPLQELVVQTKADIGFAHDGDADRVLAVDENGEVLDGDHILALAALDLKARGALKENTLVTTVMANLGLKKFLNDLDIKLEETQVGDRYVLERMLEIGSVLGGEQSGHIIFLDFNTTGDGLLTALQLASIIKRSGKKASELRALMQKYPQVLINVKVENKEAYATHHKLQEKVASINAALGDEGRVLVRPSGTEPLVRVMVEAQDIDQATKTAQLLADEIAKELNA
ncbi:MAG: phosphoglucosamine mutase [Coriobacteriia bacterium]|nr:phosphoglucosamine mutase [Coriobacteriia bacterium]